MNFPHNGKSLAAFSTQWKNFVHGMEIGAAAPTQNPSLQGTGHLVDRTLQGVVQIRDSEK